MSESPVLEQAVPIVPGLIHLYTGDGKGKTTAAAGLAVRMAGYGKKVLFCQFLKGMDSGELEPLKKLGIEVIRAAASSKFIFQMNAAEKEQAAKEHMACFNDIAGLVAASDYSLLVLDEIVDAVNTALISIDSVTSFLRDKPAALEVVLTGRNPPPAISSLADYHTDFVCVKHPYSRGVAARHGIEY